MKALTWLALVLAVAACALFFFERAQRGSLQGELAELQLAFDELDDACEIRVAELRYQFERVRPSSPPLQPAPRLAEIQQNLRQRRHALRDQALAELVIALDLDAGEAAQIADILGALETEQRELIGQARVAGTELGADYQHAAAELRNQALLALADLLGPGRLDPVLDSRLAARLGLRAADPRPASLDGNEP
ncbi:MAG: hypothetical protein JJU31_12715 [Wenzhouxiangella sp.]|nr:hypothetical protein [Wenzhouxiangella sp.]MCH8477496.1 hypothetical protein [Wenzhouxiangella sp.]